MANVEYKSTSHLAMTDQNNVYLDIYEPRTIPDTGDEFEYTLQYLSLIHISEPTRPY